MIVTIIFFDAHFSFFAFKFSIITENTMPFNVYIIITQLRCALSLSRSLLLSHQQYFFLALLPSTFKALRAPSVYYILTLIPILTLFLSALNVHTHARTVKIIVIITINMILINITNTEQQLLLKYTDVCTTMLVFVFMRTYSHVRVENKRFAFTHYPAKKRI